MAIVATITVAFLLQMILTVVLFFGFDLAAGGQVGGNLIGKNTLPGPLFHPANYIISLTTGAVAGWFCHVLYRSKRTTKFLLLVESLYFFGMQIPKAEILLRHSIYQPVLVAILTLIGIAVGGQLIHLTPPKGSKTKI